MLAGVHIINLLRNATSIGYYWYALVDVTVLLVTAAVLLAGLLRRAGHASDERTMAEAGRFYGRSAMVLLWLVLGALAFDLPIVMYLGAPHGFGDSGPADIAATLFFIVGIYVVCGFRRSDIYFNYSIIDSERYYRGVGRKIGKLALGALALLAVSAVSFCGVCLFGRPTGAQSVAIILTLLFYYIGTTAELAVLYLLYSYLEKCSYDSRTPLSASTMISLVIVIFIYAAYTLHVIFIERTAASAAAAAQGVSILSTLERYIKFALLIFLTYFGYEYQKTRKNKLLRAGCGTIIWGEVMRLLLGRVSRGLIFVFLPEIEGRELWIINRIFSVANATIEDVADVVVLAGFVMILFAASADGYLYRACRFAPAVLLLPIGIELFLRTQTDTLTVSIWHLAAEIVLLCVFAVTAATVARKMARQGTPGDE